jgi:integral membrane protein
MSSAVTSTFDVRTTAGQFRLVALAEAVSWVGLLVGMYFKYLGTPRTEIGVKIFGPVHGAVFIAFVLAAVLAGLAYRWSAGTWLLALLASFLPFGTVIFLIWADRSAKLGAAVPSAGIARISSSPVDADVTDLSA